MNDINQIISELYLAYNAKDLEKGNLLISKAKEIDENNVYLKKYIALFDGLKNNSSQNQNTSDLKIIKVKGKTLKCKFCGGNIGLSKQNNDSIELYTKNNLENLKLICNYCNKENIFENTKNKKNFKSLYLNIYIGKILKINNKKYSVIGGVKYEGIWQTKSSGKLSYIERIVLDEAGDTYYYSESLSRRSTGGESGVDKETEISRKIIPNFDLKIDGENVLIDGKETKIYEICNVKVVSSIGENSKTFTIGEDITTKQFKYKGKKYVLEYENTKNQSEIGIYETYYDKSMDYQGDILLSIIAVVFSIILALVLINFLKFFGLLLFIIIVIVGVNDKTINMSNFSKKLFLSVALFISCFYISFSLAKTEHTIKKLDLNTLSSSNLLNVKGLYKIDFESNQKQNVNISIQTYDKGGVKTTTTSLEGIKFKIETAKDLDTLKKINTGEIELNSYSKDGNNYDFSSIKFSDYFKNIISNFK